MKLWQYRGKHVRITDIDGDIFTGYADIYSYADDNADGIASLDVDMGNGALMAFSENEIANIEVIMEDTPANPLPAAAQNVV